MIPIRLSLTNFMPYRGEIAPLDFSGIHIASICGNNGSGKSSLIDAITWALWGQTRARTDDELISQGETSMQVAFDFAVGPQKYRVIRKRSRGKTKSSPGQSSLDLFIANGDIYRPISGDRIGDTEKKIIETLHMDYGTFINSAFLRQGHADQFTVARPQERKAVLTSILGLSEYDRLETAARDKANRCEADRAQLETSIRDIDVELARKPEFELELTQALDQLAEVEKIITTLDSRLIKLRAEREVLAGKQAQINQLNDQLERMTLDVNRWQERSRQHDLRVNEYNRLLDRRREIEEGYARLVMLRTLNDEMGQKLRLVNSLQERQRKLENATMQASQVLLREHTANETALSELQKKWDRMAALKIEWQKSQQDLNRVESEEKLLLERRERFQKQLNDIRQLDADYARLQDELAEISGKLSILENQTGAKCPLCERELGAEHIGLIRDKYSLEMKEKSASAKTLSTQVSAQKGEVGRLDITLKQAEAQLNKNKTGTQAKIAVLGREIGEAEEAGKQIQARREKLAEVEERLAQKDYAVEEQQALKRLDSEILEIAYDPEKHDRVRNEVTILARDYEGLKHKLDEAGRLIKEETDAAAAAIQAVRELQSSLDDYNRRKIGLASEMQDLPSVNQALAAAEAEYQANSARQKTARESFGSAREKLNRCQQMESTRSEKNSLLQQAASEESIYRELAEAFGKKGVQALLIETALPEIEAEANRLLSRMTDNRLHVKFETQRETKKGDLLETLDINISDELGTRSYEMFSGGEAFRINFAIRVALSKVLARRAGAPLPTLIVDEGFGTQDAGGMEKLKEAITSIQDDFEKILVITHIEEFRDAFPVRIDIVKGPRGSTIDVN
jgi:DNA repair protein SbcC/Rad50